MAHFAQIENGIVTQVIVADQDVIDSGAFGTGWIQTSYNTYGGQHQLGGTPFRKNFAGLNYTYDAQRDAFIPPQPFLSWVLNEETCLWQASVAKPAGDAMWAWDEGTLSWYELL